MIRNPPLRPLPRQASPQRIFRNPLVPGSRSPSYGFFAADHQWVLKQNTLTYHVSHPLHQTDGVSHAARGKGIGHEGQCDFLIAVPVKTFDSGDSDRDLHMIQVTRGAEFPMVTVRTRLPEAASGSSSIRADLEIQFAGQTVHYKQVAFELVTDGTEKRITGTIPATLTDFKIDRSTVAADLAGEERNPGPHRHDEEFAVRTCRKRCLSGTAAI